MKRWTKQAFDIRLSTGVIPWSGYVRGPLAVHLAVGNGERWVISHLPSGTNLVTLCGDFHASKRARFVADYIFDKADWVSLRPSRRKAFIAFGRALKAELDAKFGKPEITIPGVFRASRVTLNGYGDGGSAI